MNRYSLILINHLNYPMPIPIDFFEPSSPLVVTCAISCILFLIINNQWCLNYKTKKIFFYICAFMGEWMFPARSCLREMLEVHCIWIIIFLVDMTLQEFCQKTIDMVPEWSHLPLDRCLKTLGMLLLLYYVSTEENKSIFSIEKSLIIYLF